MMLFCDYLQLKSLKHGGLFAEISRSPLLTPRNLYDPVPRVPFTIATDVPGGGAENTFFQELSQCIKSTILLAGLKFCKQTNIVHFKMATLATNSGIILLWCIFQEMLQFT